MLSHIADWLADDFSPLRALQYITLRAILAALTAFLVSLLLGPRFIAWLVYQRVGQPIRELGPESHQTKAGTPTMGGTLIIAAVAASTLLWADLSNSSVWIALLCTLAFAVVGFADDWLKLKRRSSDGLSAKQKYAGQSIAAIVAAIGIMALAPSEVSTTFYVPIFKDVAIPLGYGFLLLSYLVIVGSSNAVNLTDGLDGLAIMPCVMVAAALAVFAYASGHASFAGYLGIPAVHGVGELTIFCASICGAGLGFLWFNTYPAQMFMGDVGALALGAALGVVAVLVRQEIVLFIMGGVFVAETVSVILQVGSFKLRGKRIFRMAPLHHHFELAGWAEPKIIVRFWIITLVLVLIGLATLKVR